MMIRLIKVHMCWKKSSVIPSFTPWLREADDFGACGPDALFTKLTLTKSKQRANLLLEGKPFGNIRRLISINSPVLTSFILLTPTIGFLSQLWSGPKIYELGTLLLMPVVRDQLTKHYCDTHHTILIIIHDILPYVTYVTTQRISCDSRFIS